MNIPLRSWKLSSKLAATALTILTTAVGAWAVDTFVKKEDWIPASRGWVRSWSAGPIAERNALIAQLQRDTNDRLDALTHAIESLTQGQIEQRIEMIDLRLLVMNQELTQIVLRERISPDDELMAARKQNLVEQITRYNRLRDQLSCRLSQLREIVQECSS